jgi:hypothetical protein
VFGRGELPEAVYTFKHALVQQAAYTSLLRERPAAATRSPRRSKASSRKWPRPGRNWSYNGKARLSRRVVSAHSRNQQRRGGPNFKSEQSRRSG